MADPSSFSSSSPTTNPSNPNPTATEKYLAKPPSACCFAGSLHEGVPRGTVETDIFGGIPTYVSRPSSSSSFSSEEGKTETTTTTTTKPTPANGHRNVLLYFPDVWGLSDNAKLMMDGFADAGGFLVVGMDYFLGVCFISLFFFFSVFFLFLGVLNLLWVLNFFWDCSVLPD